MPKTKRARWNHTIRDYGSRVVVSATDRTRLDLLAWIDFDGVRKEARGDLPADASPAVKSAAIAEMHAQLRRDARTAARRQRQTELFDA